MNRGRTTRALAVAALTTALVIAPSAYAKEPSFLSDCTAEDILDGVTGCGWSAIDIRVDSDANVAFSQVTSYPRAAWDQLITTYEMWEGTTEEYMASSFSNVNEPGVTYSWAVEPDHVDIRVEFAMSGANGDTDFLGFTVEGNDLVAAIEPYNVMGVDLLTVTIPGRIRESSGQVAGNVATWDAQAVASSGMLTVRGSLTPQGGSSEWLPWLLPAGGLVMLAGGAVGLGARRDGAPA